MGFLMITGTISIVIAVAFIAICIAAAKSFAEKKENNSHNEQRDRKTREANGFGDNTDRLHDRQDDNVNFLAMAATGLLFQETLNNNSNSDLIDCGSSDCNHTDCNSIDFESSSFDSSDFSGSSDVGGGSDFGGGGDF